MTSWPIEVSKINIETYCNVAMFKHRLLKNYIVTISEITKQGFSDNVDVKLWPQEVFKV